MLDEIIKCLPENIGNLIEKEIKDDIEEIRFRINKPLILNFNKEEKIINYKISPNDIIQTLHKLCDNSLYSFQKQISQGFITIKRRT